jgi:enoyl-CoA hydratase/carnithine racemase
MQPRNIGASGLYPEQGPHRAFCSTPMVALTRSIGRKHAMEMLLAGETSDAHRAAEWGLVNLLAPSANLYAATQSPG